MTERRTPAKGSQRKASQRPAPSVTPDGKNAGPRAQVDAKLAISPEISAMRVILATEKNSPLDGLTNLESLLDELLADTRNVRNGSLARAEAMLLNQATALQSLFARLAERGMRNDMVPAFEANLRMALRAQAQCRATLETLAAIKFPPVIYARQANLTTGPQQINNGVSPVSQARENGKPQNELSGTAHELLPDTRAPQATGRIDSTMAAMEEVHRPQVP